MLTGARKETSLLRQACEACAWERHFGHRLLSHRLRGKGSTRISHDKPAASKLLTSCCRHQKKATCDCFSLLTSSIAHFKASNQKLCQKSKVLAKPEPAVEMIPKSASTLIGFNEWAGESFGPTAKLERPANRKARSGKKQHPIRKL